MAGFSILAKLGLDSSKFKKGIKTSDTALSKFGTAIGNVVKAGAAVATAAFAAFTIKGVKDIVEFEKRMAEVFTLLPGITKESMDAMTADTRKLATAMGVDLMDATNALYQAISAGVPKENVIEFMTVASKAAIGGVTSLETAVDGITSVINTYGKENITAKEAADAMFTAVKLGKTTFEELSGSLFNVLPIAKQANVSFDEISAALAVMTAKGTPTSVATTQLRQAITALIAPTSKTVKHFDSYGLSVGNLKALMAGGDGGLVKAMQNVMVATNGDETAIRKLVGSTEAMNAILTLTSGNAASFGDAMVAMGDKTGATNTAFRTMEQTVAHNIKRMMGNLKELGMKFGAAFLPLINELLPTFIKKFDDLGPAVEKFAKKIPDFLNDVKDIGSHFKIWGTAVAAFMVTAKAAPAVIGAWSAAQTILGATAKGAAASTAALSTAAKISGVGAIVGSIAAVVVAYEEWGASMDERAAQMRQQDEEGWMADMVASIRALKKSEEDLTLAARATADELERKKKIHEDGDPSLHIAKTRLELAQKELDLLKKRETEALTAFMDAREHYEFEKGHWEERLRKETDQGLREQISLQMNEALAEAKRDIAKADGEIQTVTDLIWESEQKILDITKEIAAEDARNLVIGETALEIVKKVRDEHEASKTAVGQLGMMEAGLAMLQSKKLALLGAEGTKRRLNKEQADALLVIEKDILVAEGDIQNFIAGQLKLARDAEKKQVEDLNAELKKTIEREKAIAKEIGEMAEAREADVKQLRIDLKAANADLEPFRKFFNIDKFTGKVKSNMGLIGDEFRRIRAEEEATRVAILPENVRTLKQYEEMLRANAGEALKHRNNIIEMGRTKKAQAHELRLEQTDHLNEADALMTEQHNRKNEMLAKQEAAQEGEQKTLAELGVQTAALSTLLDQLKEGKIDIGSGNLQDALKALQDKFALIPPVSTDIVGAVDKVNATMAQVDAGVAALAGKDFSPTVNVTPEVNVTVAGGGGGGDGDDLILPPIPQDSDGELSLESTQIEVLDTLKGYFVNQ